MQGALSGSERSASGQDVEDSKAESAATSPRSGGGIDSVDVSLEHNTLVIMWPPTQEEWRHEVRLEFHHMQWKVLYCLT